MDYLTDPNMREMFIYLFLALVAIVAFITTLLSPILAGEALEIWRELRKGK